MTNIEDIVLSFFLNNEVDEKKTNLLKLLGEQTIKRLVHFPPSKKERTFEESFLKNVHWSWFVASFKRASQEELIIYLSSLDEGLEHSLLEHLETTIAKKTITSFAKSYIHHILTDSLLEGKKELPENFLPTSPLNKLLRLSKKDLIFFIDLLSMYDLAVEIRQIVETKILKKLYSVLSEAELKFLKHIASRQDTFTQSNMCLERWDGVKEPLRIALHKRGLSRLGAALSLQNSSLVWHLCHRLDIGRGSSLFKQVAQERSSLFAETALQQVEDLLESYG